MQMIGEFVKKSREKTSTMFLTNFLLNLRKHLKVFRTVSNLSLSTLNGKMKLVPITHRRIFLKLWSRTLTECSINGEKRSDNIVKMQIKKKLTKRELVQETSLITGNKEWEPILVFPSSYVARTARQYMTCSLSLLKIKMSEELITLAIESTCQLQNGEVLSSELQKVWMRQKTMSNIFRP